MSASIPRLAGLRVGYVPYTPEFNAPGDRRRFVNYARKRGIDFEIADPAKEYDLVVLSERADISVWCDWKGGKVVYDLIDSYLAIPSSDWKGQLRGIAKFVFGQSRRLRLNYREAVADMCSRADAVICTTEEQRKDINAYCSNAHIVLDVHQMVVAKKKQDFKAGKPFKLVWEGLPGTLSSLDLLVPVIERVARKMPIELVVVTDRKYYRHLGAIGEVRADKQIESRSPHYRWVEWRESDLAANITDCDLAVIPVDRNDPFANGKPENKLLLFWRLGMPVLASATPAYCRAMQGAGLDLLAASPEDWEAQILSLAEDADRRAHAGRSGCEYAEANYSEDRLLAAWDNVFSSIGF